MPRACHELLYGLPWISCVLAAGCQVITGASERQLVQTEGCDASGQCAACEPGQWRCDGSGRTRCDLTGNYQAAPCPSATPLCTGDGACVAACIDSADDGNPCTRDECIEGMPYYTRLADETPCAGGTCISGFCVGPCDNGRQDGQETGIDCGGSECRRGCDDGEPCKGADDCEVGVCSICTDLANCQPCSSGCNDAACGPPPVLIYNTTCFAVLVLRGGQVVESQSSEGLCESDDRRVRTRPGDQTFLYVKDPSFNTASVWDMSPDHQPTDWSGRCVGALRNRAELLEEIKRPEPVWTPKMTLPANPVLSVSCDTAALYKW